MWDNILDGHVSFVANKYNTRAMDLCNLTCPRPKCKLFENSLQFYGSHIWNTLPTNIRNASDIVSFKQLCREYLSTM